MRTLLLAVGMALLPQMMNAQPFRYDITVNAVGVVDASVAVGPQFGIWVKSREVPFGVTLPAAFNGYVIADPSMQAAGFGSILDFRLTLGTKTWTWADWIGGASARVEYVNGHLAEFWPFAFANGGDAMQLWAIRARPGRTDKGTLSISTDEGWAFCNDCAALSGPVSIVPEPAPSHLVVTGLIGLYLTSRRRRPSRGPTR